jgi:hypothetical protein
MNLAIPTGCNGMLPLWHPPMHYYPATEYDEILASDATQSCHLNGRALDCQISLPEAASLLRSEQQAVRCGCPLFGRN